MQGTEKPSREWRKTCKSLGAYPSMGCLSLHFRWIFFPLYSESFFFSSSTFFFFLLIIIPSPPLPPIVFSTTFISFLALLLFHHSFPFQVPIEFDRATSCSYTLTTSCAARFYPDFPPSNLLWGGPSHKL